MSALPLGELFDDASQFPPGDLDLEHAVTEHAAWREGPRSGLVGRLLVPARRLADLAAAATDRGWRLGAIVAAGDPPAAATDAAYALHATTLVVTAVEMPASSPAAVVDAWRDAFPAAELYLEGRADTVAASRDAGAKAKLRCGGTTVAAVPDVDVVADFVGACAELGVAFKATAGLHQPLRHLDPATGAVQYGFLNVWTAAALARERAPMHTVRAALVARRVEGLRLDERDMHAARELFEAFGTCSIHEPIDALRDLGLLA